MQTLKHCFGKIRFCLLPKRGFQKGSAGASNCRADRETVKFRVKCINLCREVARVAMSGDEIVPTKSKCFGFVHD